MPAVEAKGKRIKVSKYRVKYKDIFNLINFYKGLREWLKERSWIDLEDGTEHYETFYLEKIDMKGLKEIWIKWRPYRIPEGNSYYRYWLDFDFHCIAIQDTEIVREGKKFKVHKGEVELFITAWIDLDYEGEWSSHPILKFFNKLFPERIFRREIYDKHRIELYREAYELQNWIKQWFKLKKHLPYTERESFYPSYAWPSHIQEGK